jgi:hypothetical protein
LSVSLFINFAQLQGFYGRSCGRSFRSISTAKESSETVLGLVSFASVCECVAFNFHFVFNFFKVAHLRAAECRPTPTLPAINPLVPPGVLCRCFSWLTWWEEIPNRNGGIQIKSILALNQLNLTEGDNAKIELTPS